MRYWLKEFYYTKRKYFVLAVIYLICLVLSALFDPWTYQIGDPFYLSEQDDAYVSSTAFFQNDYSLKNIFVKLLSLGVADIANYYEPSGGVNAKRIIMVVFPLVMIIKAMISKKFFKKEKDIVELDKPKHRFLYYRSEHILAEVAADSIAFYVIGMVTRVLRYSFATLYTSTGGAHEDTSDLIYSILMVVTFPIYKAFELVIELFSALLGLLSFISLGGNDYANFFIELASYILLLPGICLLLILAFELMLKLMMRLYEAVFKFIKWIVKNVAETIKDLFAANNY